MASSTSEACEHAALSSFSSLTWRRWESACKASSKTAFSATRWALSCSRLAWHLSTVQRRPSMASPTSEACEHAALSSFSSLTWKRWESACKPSSKAAFSAARWALSSPRLACHLSASRWRPSMASSSLGASASGIAFDIACDIVCGIACAPTALSNSC